MHRSCCLGGMDLYCCLCEALFVLDSGCYMVAIRKTAFWSNQNSRRRLFKEAEHPVKGSVYLHGDDLPGCDVINQQTVFP